MYLVLIWGFWLNIDRFGIGRLRLIVYLNVLVEKFSFSDIGWWCVVFCIGIFLVCMCWLIFFGLVYSVELSFFFWVRVVVILFCVVLVSRCSVWYRLDLLLLLLLVISVRCCIGIISVCSEW